MRFMLSAADVKEHPIHHKLINLSSFDSVPLAFLEERLCVCMCGCMRACNTWSKSNDGCLLRWKSQYVHVTGPCSDMQQHIAQLLHERLLYPLPCFFNDSHLWSLKGKRKKAGPRTKYLRILRSVRMLSYLEKEPGIVLLWGLQKSHATKVDDSLACDFHHSMCWLRIIVIILACYSTQTCVMP